MDALLTGEYATCSKCQRTRDLAYLFVEAGRHKCSARKQCVRRAKERAKLQ